MWHKRFRVAYSLRRVYRLRRRAFCLSWAMACIPTSTLAQAPENVDAVKNAQRSAYVISDATNGCPAVGSDMLGWPGDLVRKCVYREGPPNKRLTGIAYVLTVKPETIAQWIESACSNQLPGLSGCFNRVLRCGVENSGMIFAISGNVLENMDPTTYENFFFRNGMTVSIGGQPNGTTQQIALDRQDALAQMPDSEISRIPSGLTRFWRTRPEQFAKRFPNGGAPTDLNSPDARQKWLDLARSEILAALRDPTNRLLEAWVGAHPVTLGKLKCPEDADP